MGEISFDAKCRRQVRLQSDELESGKARMQVGKTPFLTPLLCLVLWTLGARLSADTSRVKSTNQKVCFLNTQSDFPNPITERGMADPFAIIGLTASIVSFIDFSLKIVSTGKEIYDSGRDTTQQNHELRFIVEDIRRKNQEFRKTQTNATRKLHNDELQVIKLAAESDKVAEKLQKLLGKLKTRPGHWKITEAGRIAIVSRKRKNEVDDLRDRLLRLDDRVRYNLGYALQG